MMKPHILVIPYPFQGHVNPLMDFSRQLAKHGFKITFANTEFNHQRILQSLASNSSSSSSKNNKKNNDDDDSNLSLDEQVRLVSIADELGPEEHSTNLVKFVQGIIRDMPAKIEELINTINKLEGENGKITCVLLDGHMGWALEVADKMGIRGAVVWPASASIFAVERCIPRLIDEGIIDGNNGMSIKRQMYQLSSSMPTIDPANFPWSCFHDLATNKIAFDYLRRSIKALNIAKWWVCNTIYELEPAAFSLVPKLKPIGPLMASPHEGNAGAQFWPEDPTCLNWLDQQPAHSVIYVSFGSLVIMEQTQFAELAHGLELTNKPFLWVVRPEIIDGLGHENLDGFLGNKGKIVSWAPQQNVLSHPAIACFLSHCGWNSTMEGLSNGVPFLCWPYFADQLLNHDYICDVWKVGLRFDKDESGIITRSEVMKNVEKLLGDEEIKARSLELKELATTNMAAGSQSSNNFNDFIEWLSA